MIQYVTDAGIDMMRDVLQSKGTLAFTRFEVGSGPFDPKSGDPKSMTALVKATASVAVSRVAKEDGGVAVYADLTNGDIPDGTKLAETGVWARVGDGAERLFCYAYDADPPTVPPASETFYQRRFISHIAMGDGEMKVVAANDKYAEIIRETLGLYRDQDGYLCQD